MSYVGTSKLESKQWSANGTVLQQFKGLPANQRIAYLMLETTATVHNSSGGSLSVAPHQLAFLINNFNLDASRVKIRSTGRGLLNLYHKQHGQSLCDSSTLSVAITDGHDGTVRAYQMIEFVDQRSASPTDCVQPTALLEGKNIEIGCSPTGTIQSGLVVTAATFATTVWYLPSAGAVVPSRLEIDYFDWTGQTVDCGKGAFTDVFIYDEDGSTLTLSDYTSITLRSDGVNVLDNLPTEQIVAQWNYLTAIGAGGVTGEQEDPANPDYLPLISPPPQYALSQVPQSANSTQVMITGAATSSRFLTRRITATTQADDNVAAQALGVPQPQITPRAAKTASKRNLSGSPAVVKNLTAILPKRFGTSSAS